MNDLSAVVGEPVDREAPQTRLPWSFVRDVGTTVATRGGVLVLGLVSSIIVNRALGPSGRGELAIATALAGLLSTIGTLGMHAANTYELGRDRSLLGVLLGNSFVLAILGGTICGAVVALVGLVAPGALGVPGGLLLLVIIAVPVGSASTLVQNLLLALTRVRAYNVAEFGQRLLFLAGLALLLSGGLLSATTVLLVTVAAGAAALGYASVQLRSDEPLGLRVSWATFRGTIGYSLRGFAASLAAYLVVRLDVLLLDRFAGATEVGVYAVAVSVADLMLVLPTVVGLLLFPRLTGDSSVDRFRLASLATVCVGVLMALLAAVAWPSSELAVTLLYGDSFEGSGRALQLLLPGVVALSVTTTTNTYLASVGMPASILVGPVLALAVNIAVNVAITPTMGADGAAIASTSSYAAMLLAAGVAAWRAHRSER